MSCGYGCSGCGRCQGGFVSKIVPKGICDQCGTLNSPTAKVCKKCGAEITNKNFKIHTPGTR
jgi:ribosomal protein L40E